MKFLVELKKMLEEAKIPLMPTLLVTGIVIGALIPTSLLMITGVLGFMYWLVVSTPDPAKADI